MASTFGGNRIATTAQAHGLTVQRGRQIARGLSRSVIAGMVQWLDLPENQNADEAAWKAAWPALGNLANDSEVQFVMDFVADLGGGFYVP